jgi:hypothetical protein
MPTRARTFCHSRGAWLVLALFVALLPGRSAASPPAEGARRNVYLARGLSDESLITLQATLAAFDPDSLLLLDTDATAPHVKAFLASFRPARIVPIGSFPSDGADLETRLGLRPEPIVAWTHGPPLKLWHSLFSRAEQVVVCPAGPRAQLLQAACLAGALRAPLFVVHGKHSEAEHLETALRRWRVRQVHLVGKAPRPEHLPEGVQITHLPGESAVATAHRRLLAEQGPIDVLVVANPADGKGRDSLAALAPWVARKKRAALLLTGGPRGDAAKTIQRALAGSAALRRADAILFLADLKAIPTWTRPNPIPGDKDPHIEMEPLTPTGDRPFTFATGRLFHSERAVVPLILARQRLLAEAQGPRRALVASNPGGGLHLLETFSRNTAHELRNAGYEVTALFGDGLTAGKLREQLPRHDLFLWEGHHNTLIKDWEFPSWDEPLPPSFVFLQSCLALTGEKVGPLLSRGAVAVIGSSTRTYSASGGACSLAFFDGVLYDEQTVGGALRQSKNFLLAYARLKEKRLGKEAMRTGANLRAAWAFTLWGDPTLKLPAPPVSGSGRALPPVRHEVKGNTVVLSVPEGRRRVATERYEASLPADARLAGLVRKRSGERRSLVPLVFAEVHLPRARPGLTPVLSGRLPSSRWVFTWDERRRCGYLLALPRQHDGHELRFHVHWAAPEAARSMPANPGE